MSKRMVEHARRVRPHLDMRLGDVRTFRLGRQVDVVICVGNTLAYVHSDEDLTAAFATFVAHMVAPGGVLVVQTITAPIEAASATSRVDSGDVHAQVTVSSTWDPTCRLTTMHRHWRHDDGSEDHDVIARRVCTLDELRAAAERVGLASRPLADDAKDWFVATRA